MILTKPFPSSAPEFAGRLCFDRDATLEAFAASLGGVYSWGCAGTVRKCITKTGVMIGADVVGPNFSQLLVSSTSPQPFDGVYSLKGEKLKEVSSYAFFGRC